MIFLVRRLTVVAPQWAGFNVDHKWLIRTEQGKRILIVEADSSVGEESLSLRHDIDEDLTIQDASQVSPLLNPLHWGRKEPSSSAWTYHLQAFFMIEQRLRKDPAVTPEDKVIRVLLADPQMSIVRSFSCLHTSIDASL